MRVHHLARFLLRHPQPVDQDLRVDGVGVDQAAVVELARLVWAPDAQLASERWNLPPRWPWPRPVAPWQKARPPPPDQPRERLPARPALEPQTRERWRCRPRPSCKSANSISFGFGSWTSTPAARPPPRRRRRRPRAPAPSPCGAGTPHGRTDRSQQAPRQHGKQCPYDRAQPPAPSRRAGRNRGAPAHQPSKAGSASQGSREPPSGQRGNRTSSASGPGSL